MQRLVRLVALFISMLVVGLPTVFLLARLTTGNAQAAIRLTLYYLAALVVSTVLMGILYQILHDFVDQISRAIVDVIAQLIGRYRKTYMDTLSARYHNFDTRGLTSRGEHDLPLGEVYVELALVGTERKQTTSGTIWEHIGAQTDEGRKLVVIGPPGSGKTTLLKEMVLVLANPQKHAPSRSVPKKIPVLLMLREQEGAIQTSSEPLLADIIDRAVMGMEIPAPAGWFKTRLQRGECVVMLDGLDEVADSVARAKVVRWVESQMLTYRKNTFVITSRPFGYMDNPLQGVDVLTIKPFRQEQVATFINRWYLANERMRSKSDDYGVRLRAKESANNLIKVLGLRPALSALAVNPLLVTMIATVHSYRGVLPQRRVELYRDIFEVFLRRRTEVWAGILLSPNQIMEVLTLLGFHMMVKELRTVETGQAVEVIKHELAKTGAYLEPETFLKNVDHQSGLLLEVENGQWAFAHLTFQEYLASRYIWEDRTDTLRGELVNRIADSWWVETVRLFTAQADATNIIEACLQEISPSPSALSLALDCVTEALKIEPSIRAKLDKILRICVESDDPELRAVAAEAKLSSRLRWMIRISETVMIDTSFVTNVEYQLFLDQMRERGEYYYPDHWTDTRFLMGQGNEPVLGVRPKDALAFCDWLTARDIWYRSYRLPTLEEVRSRGLENGLDFAYWMTSGDAIALSTEGKSLDSLSVTQETIIAQLNGDLKTLVQLMDAMKQRSVTPVDSETLLERWVPVTGRGRGMSRPKISAPSVGSILPHAGIDRLSMIGGLLKDSEMAAEALDLDFTGLVQLASSLFTPSLDDAAKITSWLPYRSHVQYDSIFDLGRNFGLTAESFESIPGKGFGDFRLTLRDMLLRALGLLESRQWARGGDGSKVRRIYTFLRWYTRLCAAALGAASSRYVAVEGIVSPFNRRIVDLCDTMVTDLVLLELRVSQQKPVFEGIVLVKLDNL